MAFIKEESEVTKIEDTFRINHEDTEEQAKMMFIEEENENIKIKDVFSLKQEDTEKQTKMAFIKEESEDMRIEDVFSITNEDTETQTREENEDTKKKKQSNMKILRHKQERRMKTRKMKKRSNMKILRHKQVGLILKAELSHLIFIQIFSSTEMKDIFENVI